MKTKIYGILLASVGAFALTVTTNETFAASRGGHAASHHSAAHSFRHHHRPQAALVWGDDGYFYGPTGGAVVEGGMPLTGEVRDSNASDIIPWDWAHRYPPVLSPSGRPYVSNCGTDAVTVPDGRGGTGQVNVTRCY